MPFVSVNSGGIPEGLLESELFGHMKGSYTGAHSTTIGRFQAAEGGTLFLDEVGNMSMAMQVKLLRTLQEREVTPVGANSSVSIDVRLVAATNSDLEAEVRAGRFREDLYFRINVIDIHIPPLRERREDIIPLAEYFLAAHSAARDIKLFLSPQCAVLLSTYSWPGNVRELENAMERASVLSTGEITPTHLPSRITAGYPGGVPLPSEGAGLDEIVAAVERVYIHDALKSCGGVRSRAARMLGIKRTTLLARMRKLGLESELERALE
jgi:DNA-binding NtrC family response regulator